MKSHFIFTLVVLMALSGCQGIKKNAVVVTPIYLPITPEEGSKPLDTLYTYLKNKNIRLDIVSKDPFIYQIPRQKGLLEELAKILKTIRSITEVHTTNLANANTMKAKDGNPYRRKGVVINKDFEIVEIIDDPYPFRKIYDPGHPHADEDGYVMLPNINEMTEKVHIMAMQRLYNTIIKLIEKTYQNGIVF